MIRSSAVAKRRFRSFRKRKFRSTRHQKKRKNLVILSALSTIFLVFVILLFFGSTILFTFYSKDLPAPNKLTERDIEQSTRIFDRDGDLLFDVYGEKNRTLVTLDNVSPQVVNATLAIEDAEFYKHQGFDLFGIGRAFMNILKGRGLQGGSTLTQQLMKNALLSTERTVSRKIKELILALQVEKRYNKDEILQMYLNESPYGGQAWGIEAASELYFNKEAKELSLAESALLAGLPQSPTLYSPFGSNPEKAKERQEYVLYLMNKRGWLGADGQTHYITDDEYEVAKAEELEFSVSKIPIKAPHFVMYVKSLLEQRYGERLVEQGGLKVTTTLDLEMQEKAQEILTEEVENAKGLQVGNGALVAMENETGQILAMVGSKDYFDEDYDGKVNVTLSQRQPGSAIKPITYAEAFRQGYTADTVIMDVQTEFPGGPENPIYSPENYDGKFRGPMQLRFGLANSINVAAVKLLSLVGVENMMLLARDMGITTFTDPARYGLSLTLGGGEVRLVELVNAFSTLGTGGIHYDPVSILRVTDAKGNVLEEYKDEMNPGVRALEEEVAYLVSDILRDDNARSIVFGTGGLLNVPGKTVSVKTGTTDDKRDNWCVGYSNSLTVGVWVGNNDNTPMNKSLASGLTGATPIWSGVMREYLKDKADEPLKRPDNIVDVEIDKYLGGLPVGDEEKRTEKFISGTEPIDNSEYYVTLEICKDDGKIASEACKDSGNAEERRYIDLRAKRDEWQEFVDKWVEETYPDDEKYNPPRDQSEAYFDEEGKYLGGVAGPLIRILEPSDNEILPLEFDISVEVSSPFTVLRVDYLIDEIKVDSSTSVPYQKTIILSSDLKGPRTLTVRAEDSGGGLSEKSVEITVN